MNIHHRGVEVCVSAKPGERPENVNAVAVTVQAHEQMRRAPIHLSAGCSWASLDVDAAKALIVALNEAIAIVESEGVVGA